MHSSSISLLPILSVVATKNLILFLLKVERKISELDTWERTEMEHMVVLLFPIAFRNEKFT